MTAVLEIELGEEQRACYQAIREWLNRGDGSFLTLGGYAGTGKTTLISYLIRELKREKKLPTVAFCCYTGKAAFVLRDKLQRAGIEPAYCGTIHSLMYKPILDENQRIKGWERKRELAIGWGEDKVDVDLLVVDEASMVNEVVWQDLMSYGVPALAVGDHGQLPPIGTTFNLMEKPALRLTKVHRQAEGDPIIHLSMVVREQGTIPFGQMAPNVTKVKASPAKLIAGMTNFADTLFLCGYNWTRITVNRLVRQKLGCPWPTRPADRVVCLKNNRKEGIFNGMGGVIQELYPIKEDSEPNAKYLYRVRILMDDETTFYGKILKAQFGAQNTIREHEAIKPEDLKAINLFDYGYCLTVHKAQGSEARNVCVFEERNKHMDDEAWRRWLYTAVTRARERLLVVGK